MQVGGLVISLPRTWLLPAWLASIRKSSKLSTPWSLRIPAGIANQIPCWILQLAMHMYWLSYTVTLVWKMSFWWDCRWGEGSHRLIRLTIQAGSITFCDSPRTYWRPPSSIDLQSPFAKGSLRLYRRGLPYLGEKFLFEGTPWHWRFVDASHLFQGSLRFLCPPFGCKPERGFWKNGIHQG